jgi:2-polyprenyl-3-methyl-5-hydroxy-6-metoxy-1,4-benzoquinol methylase
MINMKANSPQLWDKVWRHDPTQAEDIYTLKKEENGIRWQRIERVVLKEFGTFNGLKVVEIGAGGGTNAAIMAKRAAQISVIDYSQNALERARHFFKNNGVQADFILQNALSMAPEFHDQFDVSMSFGLTEHFKGPARVDITKAHFDILRKGGLAFISVPNKYNLPYQIWKLAAQLAKTWTVGEEYPYSRRELIRVCQQIGITDYSFFGDSLLASIYFINPFQQIQKLRILFKSLNSFDVSKIKREKGTPLDAHLAYALVLCAKK